MRNPISFFTIFMKIIDNNGRIIVSFSSNIRVRDRITIPHKVRTELKSNYNIDLNNGMLLKISINNNNKTTSFIRKVLEGFRVEIPYEDMEYHEFNIGEQVEVKLEIDKSKIEE